MKRLQVVIAAALLVLWMPATSYCLAENAGWIGCCGCCEKNASGDVSPCCTLASAVYKSDSNARTLSPPVIALTLALVDIERINDSSGDLSTGAIAPTKPAHTWHFVARAAASPRAPTLAS